jgi:hypothetical protein
MPEELGSSCNKQLEDKESSIRDGLRSEITLQSALTNKPCGRMEDPVVDHTPGAQSAVESFPSKGGAISGGTIYPGVGPPKVFPQ